MILIGVTLYKLLSVRHIFSSPNVSSVLNFSYGDIWRTKANGVGWLATGSDSMHLGRKFGRSGRPIHRRLLNLVKLFIITILLVKLELVTKNITTKINGIFSSRLSPITDTCINYLSKHGVIVIHTSKPDLNSIETHTNTQRQQLDPCLLLPVLDIHQTIHKAGSWASSHNDVIASLQTWTVPLFRRWQLLWYRWRCSLQKWV